MEMQALRKEIMGVSFDDLTLEEAVRRGAELAAGPGFSYVVTPNPEIVNLARQAPDYEEILNGAGLVLPDGIGVGYAAGTNDGYFQDSAPVVEKIKASNADVVFVCLGAPKQERWMAQYGPATGAHLMVGLGGVLDVYAGNVKRAPAAWQKLGLEWLYRLVREPKRIRRMIRLPEILLIALRERK